ncbi:MAG: hypothetical protein KGJ78_17970 [Alphaproteobacteria bacterium]|nr:hypothetical protein [Alphaproteobacteria bacterium]
MKLLLRRSERSSMVMGKPVYILEVRVEVSSEEKGWIEKYKFGPSVLYTRKGAPPQARNWAEAGQVLLHVMTDLTVTVNDLVHGKKVECKDIMEMLAVEAQIREAAQNFAQVLRAASQFGGEEVIDL